MTLPHIAYDLAMLLLGVAALSLAYGLLETLCLGVTIAWKIAVRSQVNAYTRERNVMLSLIFGRERHT